MMLPQLVARGGFSAYLFISSAYVFAGLFWIQLEDTMVNCRDEQKSGLACAEGILATVTLGLLCANAVVATGIAIALPLPKIRSLEDRKHHWLSSEFTHVAYTYPDIRGYQHVLYLNHPTSPSKIRFNVADPGTHFSKLRIRDTEDLSRWPKREGAIGEAYVDFSRDDEMPPLFNNFKEIDVLKMGNTLSRPMLQHLADNKLNGSCFLAQSISSNGIRSGIVKVMPSADGDDNDFPVLECGTDIKAFNITVPLN